jgi:hypothetical protein
MLLPLFVTHPELIGILGHKARQRVLTKYTLNSNISQLEKLYAQVLSHQRVRVSLF